MYNCMYDYTVKVAGGLRDAGRKKVAKPRQSPLTYGDKYTNGLFYTCLKSFMFM